MNAYIINLPGSTKRRNKMELLFSNSKIQPIFIKAIKGEELKLPDSRFAEKRYKLAHGKHTNLAELGCYFSHLKALDTFLKSSDSHSLILEDDLEVNSPIEPILEHCLKYRKYYDLLKLSGLHNGSPSKIFQIDTKFNLSINLTQQTGSGAYLVNRHAAKQIVSNLIPMWLPFDHAFDREWVFGIKTMRVDPFPFSQNTTNESQIVIDRKKYKLSKIVRLPVLIFRAYNEISRIYFRSLQISKHRLER